MSCLNPLNLLVDCLVDFAAIDASDLDPETKRWLHKIKDSTTIFAVKQADGFIKEVQDPPTDADVKTELINLGWKKTGEGFDEWTKDRVMKISHNISPSFSTVILGQDDLFGRYTILEKIVGVATRNRLLLPLEDHDLVLGDDELAARISDDLKFEMGKALPQTYNTDFNMLTDESFSRIFFYGMGSVLIAKQEEVSSSEYGPFVVDLKVLQGLKYRSKYRKLGSRIHFNKDQMVTAIHDYDTGKTHTPGSDGWENAKTLAKVGAFLLMTAREHLTWTHLVASNIATRESTLNLAPSHPIRRLLTVFTFRATEVNLAAFDSLVPNTSILHRSAGLKYSSMVDVFEHSYKSCTIFEPFADRKYNSAVEELIDEDKFPFASQGKAYYEIVRDFVKDWISNCAEAASDAEAMAFYNAVKAGTKGMKYEIPEYSQENMINVLSSIIFAVTGYHELIGHVVDYTLLPSRAGFRLTKKDPSEVDFQSYLLTNVISASTSVPMPMLMEKFPNFFGVGGPEWERTVWDSFHTKLVAQSEKVQAADKKRAVEYKYFDPSRFECSVSV